MSNVFQRQIGMKMPLAVSGKGPYIIDEDGRHYLDASCGAAVSCLGHNDKDVIDAIKKQIESLPFSHTAFFSTQPTEALATFLVSKGPEGTNAVYFVSGGSEGVEAALKMTRQYFLEVGQPKRKHFIARRQSYHGNTLGALSVGGNVWRRKPYEEMLMKISHISPCYVYRGKGAGETEEQYGYRVASELETQIIKLGPENVAAFIAETVGGATAGVIEPVSNYFKKIREICDRYGVILILDEVMCGMGRTGTLFACEQEDINPDITVVAKGLGAGYQPIGAVLVNERIYKAFQDGSKIFLHGHTYMGHATACAAAMAVQKKIQDLKLLSNVQAMGQLLMAALRKKFNAHPYVGDIRGRGLFIGIEIVANRVKKTPFKSQLKVHSLIKAKAMDNGLLCYPGGGTLNGLDGDHILIAPPYIIDESHVSEIITKLGKTIDEVFKTIGAQV